MCGIFGFIGHGGRTFRRDRLRQLARATERRGAHAWGLAWLDGRGRLRHYKQPGPITRALDLLDDASDAQLLIGHCRYATRGDYRTNLNNHPFPLDGGWLIHNGQIHDYDEHVAAHDLRPVTDCDSELLAMLAERADAPTQAARLAAAVSLIDARPLACAALWRAPKQLVVIRDGHPVHAAEAKEGFYFASLADNFPGCEPVPDRTALIFTPRAEQTKWRTVKLPRRAETMRLF